MFPRFFNGFGATSLSSEGVYAAYCRYVDLYRFLLLIEDFCWQRRNYDFFLLILKFPKNKSTDTEPPYKELKGES